MPVSQRTKIASGVAAAVALLTAGVWRLAPWRTESPPPPPAPPGPVAVPVRPPPVPEPQLERKVIGHVGDLELTNLDLARYQKFREASLGVISGPQALNELCERALLGLAAADHQLALSPAVLEQELLRRKIIIGATSSALRAQGTPGMPGGPGATARGYPTVYPQGARYPGVPPTGMPPTGVPGMPGPGTPGAMPPSPLDAGEQVLASMGLSRADVEAEVKADALAQLAKQVLVYDRISISRRQLKQAYAAEQRSPSHRQPYARPLGSRRRADEATVNRLRQRLRREQGAEPLRALLEHTKEKYKFDCGTN